ncbi:hypothetical protein DRN87_00905 [Candidatus Geothermarchaeota archaeon]|nr:MAG: hypothetical protein DRN87_00905 [Candidatus Geothermarchaeota archaeon]
MNILIIEGIIAGLVEHFEANILPEALSMLMSLSNDISRLGYKTSILVHKKYLDFIPISKLKNITVIKNTGYNINSIRKVATKYDYTYVIAPESDGLLYKLLIILEGLHINSDPDTIARISDKFRVINDLEKTGINVPKTLYLEKYRSERELQYIIRNLEFPMIIKPSIGAGCQGLRIIKSKEELRNNLRKLSVSYKTLILQEYIKGLPASISVVSDGVHYKILSINRQFIKFSEIGYWGGYTPIRGISLKVIENIVRKISRLYSGLKGYFGIDIIISKDKVYVIEINPRLTVSYIGISKTLSVNPAKLLLKSTLKRNVGYEISHQGIAYFRKIRFNDQFSRDSAFKIYNLYKLYTPPMPFLSSPAYAFILVTGSSFRKTVKDFRDLIKDMIKNLRVSITT